eukprot:753296-Hanusia_phi.AAC.1
MVSLSLALPPAPISPLPALHFLTLRRYLQESVRITSLHASSTAQQHIRYLPVVPRGYLNPSYQPFLSPLLLYLTQPSPLPSSPPQPFGSPGPRKGSVQPGFEILRRDRLEALLLLAETSYLPARCSQRRRRCQLLVPTSCEAGVYSYSSTPPEDVVAGCAGENEQEEERCKQERAEGRAASEHGRRS